MLEKFKYSLTPLHLAIGYVYLAIFSMSKRLYREDSDVDLTGSYGDSIGKRANRFIKLKVPYKGKVYYKSNEISRGNHSIVYKVYNKDETELFAGKELRNNGIQLQKNKTSREIQMYKIISQKSNNNIVKMVDWFQNKNKEIYLILEYCSEGSLLSLLHYRKSFPEQYCKWIILQIAHGLNWLHENNIVHGDLKLANILINEKEELKISDFGHSFMINDSKKFQQGNEINLGTPTYLAAEIVYKFRGINESGLTNKAISYPIDLWSLGIILYNLVYGNNPFTIFSNNFHKMTYDELMQNITSNKIEFPQIPETSIALKKIILKLLRQHPLKRLTILELVTCKWLRKDFTTKFKLLDNHKVNVNVSDSQKEFLQKLTEFKFISENGVSLHKNILKSKYKKMTLKKLILKAKLERTKLDDKYDNLVKILPIMLTNHIREPTTNQIIKDEWKLIINNLCEIEWNKKNSHEFNPKIIQDISNSLLNNKTEDSIFVKKNKVMGEDQNNILNVYQLSTGQYGCFFNDESDHSILINEAKDYFWYICTDNKYGYFAKSFDEKQLNKLPMEINNKIDKLKECKMELEIDISNENSFINNISNNINHDDKNGRKNQDVFLRKFLIFQDYQIELYYLSNSTLQIVDNLQEKMILIENFGQLITWNDSMSSLISVEYEKLISRNFVIDNKEFDYVSKMLQTIKEIMKREIS